MPPGLSSGSRVRVVSPSLGSAWQPGRTLLSTNGCWIVQAAVTYDPKAITVLTPRQVTRLQVSEAVPPPDWWAVPEDAEGWSELLPGVLEEASTPKCRQSFGHTRSVGSATLGRCIQRARGGA